jgi:hypothetical protein
MGKFRSRRLPSIPPSEHYRLRAALARLQLALSARRFLSSSRPPKSTGVTWATWVADAPAAGRSSRRATGSGPSAPTAPARGSRDGSRCAAGCPERRGLLHRSATTPVCEPADQPAEHYSGLGCERHVRRHADDDAHRQAQQGSKRDRGPEAHRRESMCRPRNDRDPRTEARGPQGDVGKPCRRAGGSRGRGGTST